MLTIKIENNGEGLVLRCAGRIVAGEEVASLKAAVVCHQDSKIFVVELGIVQMLDGAGVGLLAFLAGWSRVVGTSLKVMIPIRHVQVLFGLLDFDFVRE